MRIGELASEAGVNIQTIRYYERRGLIKPPPRKNSGYREYRPEAVRLIRSIKWAQRLGFTLKEIKELVALQNLHTCGYINEVQAKAKGKIADIESKIERLKSIRQALKLLVECDCNDACPMILESLGYEKETAKEKAALKKLSNFSSANSSQKSLSKSIKPSAQR